MKKSTEISAIVYICFIEMTILFGLGLNRPLFIKIFFGFLQGIFLYITIKQLIKNI